MKNALILTLALVTALMNNFWNASIINAQDIPSETISIAASKRGNPFINFTDGKIFTSPVADLSAASATAPLALAAADFDADGDFKLFGQLSFCRS